MVKTDICIEPFFPGLSSLEKIKEIARLNINAIEFWFWDHEFDGKDLLPVRKDIDSIAIFNSDHNILVNDIVVNSTDGEIGGTLLLRSDRDKYLSRLNETIEIAGKLKCSKLITCTGNIQEGLSAESQRDSIIEILAEASSIAGKEGITLLLEALNSTIDHPGYFLTSSKAGFDIVKQVNNPYLKLLYDVYHMQIMEGNIINTISENISLIGHFHSAGLPRRNELYSGELDYSNIIKHIDSLNYDGYFGLEYWPTGDSARSLITTLDYLNKL